jgi:predicted methyltransferase
MKSLLSLLVCSLLFVGNVSALDIAALEAAMANPARSAEDKERDPIRKAPQVLDFLGLEAGMTVYEIAASTGWYTEVLSYAVGPNGKVFAQNRAGSPGATAVAAKAARLGNVESFEADIATLAENSVDFAFTALNYHDFYNSDPTRAAAIMAGILRVLKPGGILGIVDHEGNPGADNQALHRIAPGEVQTSVTAAGFTYVATSDVLHNPADDRTLPQSDASLQRNTDRFVMKFTKP